MVVLPGGYVLDGDDHNVALYRDLGSVDKKTGKPNRKEIGYYKDIPQALEGWYQHLQRDLVKAEEPMELKELVAAVRALHNEAMRTIRGTILPKAPGASLKPQEAASPPQPV